MAAMYPNGRSVTRAHAPRQVTIIETDINVDFEAPLDHADGAIAWTSAASSRAMAPSDCCARAAPAGLMGAAAKAKEEAAKAPPPAPEPVCRGPPAGLCLRSLIFSYCMEVL